ncbi:MAG: hypothetical protein Q8O67_29630 [Deltaproteobacteria bacterium]|nr:hypothetical protein [Deltaproteobacteria bacterium]
MRHLAGLLFLNVLALAACGGLECALPGFCVEGEGEGEGEEGEGEGEGEELGENDFSAGCPIGTLDLGEPCFNGGEIMQADCDDGDRFEVVLTNTGGGFFDCRLNGETFTDFSNTGLCDLDLDVPADRRQAIIRLRDGCDPGEDF